MRRYDNYYYFLPLFSPYCCWSFWYEREAIIMDWYMLILMMMMDWVLVCWWWCVYCIPGAMHYLLSNGYNTTDINNTSLFSSSVRTTLYHVSIVCMVQRIICCSMWTIRMINALWFVVVVVVSLVVVFNLYCSWTTW